MALNVAGVYTELKDTLYGLGVFESVSTHEPKNSPTGGRVSIIFSGTRPGPSGLASTSVFIDFTIRLFADMMHEPQDEIDPNTLAALDATCAALVANFTLGGTAESVDVRGKGGIPVTSRTGYADYSGTIYRVCDITVPVLINDLWSESP